MSKKPLIKSKLPTVHGAFEVWAFAGEIEPMPHLALVTKDLDFTQPVYLRIHSECMTGDVFGSKRCDCGQQLSNAMEFIDKKGGVLIYLRQEGRGIGLAKKLEAYNLQDQGLDTIDANHALGFQTDERNYNAALDILTCFGIKVVKLITNSPSKIHALSNAGIEVIEQIHLPTILYPENQDYLNTKATRMGHRFPEVE